MAATTRFTCFATPIGGCALAWTDAGICNVWLPESRPGGLREGIARRWPSAAEAALPDAPAGVVEAICALLAGTVVDLQAVRLDLSAVSGFGVSVYAVTRGIAPGRVLTYAAVAARVGGASSPRAVGQALGDNPVPLIVPCHRVVAAAGRLGGFSAPGGTDLKRRLLAIERARPDGAPSLFDDEPR